MTQTENRISLTDMFTKDSDVHGGLSIDEYPYSGRVTAASDELCVQKKLPA